MPLAVLTTQHSPHAVFFMYTCSSALNITYSSTVHLYVRFKKFRFSCPKISPQKQLNIYFVAYQQHWLGIAKLKSVILNPSTKLLRNFKLCYLTEFLTD